MVKHHLINLAIRIAIVLVLLVCILVIDNLLSARLWNNIYLLSTVGIGGLIFSYITDLIESSSWFRALRLRITSMLYLCDCLWLYVGDDYYGVKVGRWHWIERLCYWIDPT